MTETNLFEAIRREEVIIFAGAGFSAYAGFPLGKDLANKFIEALPPEDIAQLDTTAPLDYITENIERLKQNRYCINSVLEAEFTKPPSSLADHHAIASIPHFKTIVTTNYDTLFEQAYNDRAKMIFNEHQISMWKDGHVHILKIHGDISDMTSIILTRGDYAKFYRKDYSSPFWATITQAIATKTVLFLGYGYEDPNVWSIFEHVQSYIGSDKLKAYFVSPDAGKVKMNFLASKGINYIDETGTSFVQKLLKNIKDNIFSDFHNGWITPETFRLFTNQHGLAVGIMDSGNGYQLNSIEGAYGQPVNGAVSFNIENGSSVMDRFQDFSNGKSEEFTLAAADVINFRIDVEDLKLFDDENTEKISFSRIPLKIPFDLVFASKDLDIPNLVADLYHRPFATKIKTRVYSLYSETFIDRADTGDLNIKWNISHQPNNHTINEELTAYRIIQYVYSQEPLTVYLKGHKPMVFKCPVYREDFVKDAGVRIAYLLDLKIIEQALGIRFTDISDINEESFSNLKNLLKIINGERFPIDTDLEITFDELSPGLVEGLEKLNGSNLPFEITMNGNPTFSLHGHTINIPGVHVEVPDPEILNLEELRNDSNKVLKVRSKGGTIYHTYHLTPFPKHE